ncbi:MAG: nuclear transport factor 2 family protein [Actinobacteria bacterium]|nr:nuclear transport factor 2 family protein [Actinomycetota bacterium]
MALAGLSACSSGDSASTRAAEKARDEAAISNIEVLFHRAVSTKDIDTMMSIFAPNAVMTLGGKTYTGQDEIRNFWQATSAPFKPENHWVSDTPAYRIRVSSNGDRGTLYFECHYIDVDSKTIRTMVSADIKASRLNGHWIVTNLAGSPANLT